MVKLNVLTPPNLVASRGRRPTRNWQCARFWTMPEIDCFEDRLVAVCTWVLVPTLTFGGLQFPEEALTTTAKKNLRRGSVTYELSVSELNFIAGVPSRWLHQGHM